MKAILLFFAVGIAMWVYAFYDMANGSRAKAFFTGSYLGETCFAICLIAAAVQSGVAIWRCFRPKPKQPRRVFDPSHN